MRKYLALIAILILQATSANANLALFPALYDVTGVTTNDVLNVRAKPGTSHPIIETLAYDDRHIEIIRLNDDGTWGLIGYPNGSGWTSMRYLERQPNQSGPTLPRPLSCGGNEPFWGISFGLQDNEFFEPGALPNNLTSAWEAIPAGMQPVAYGIKLENGGDKMDAIITRRQCSDGMSGKAYGFEINALLSGTLGDRMLSGCCSLVRPQN